MRKRKRCPHCWCLFSPDGRVAGRQRACSKSSCQQARRRETQRRYRDEHPADAAARRLRTQLSDAKAGAVPAAPRAPPAAIARLPWEELRDEISPQAFVITTVFSRLLVGVAQDVIRAQLLDIRAQIGRSPRDGPKDETDARSPAA